MIYDNNSAGVQFAIDLCCRWSLHTFKGLYPILYVTIESEKINTVYFADIPRTHYYYLYFYFFFHTKLFIVIGRRSSHHLMKFGCSLMKHFIARTGILYVCMYARHLNWIWVLLALLDTRWYHRFKYTPHITIILIITTAITNIKYRINNVLSLA